MFDAQFLAIAGGALVSGAGLLGSVIGISIAASAGAATLAEDPRQLRNVIILASLPMTQSFYGLIILILILTSVVPKIAAMPEVGNVGLVALAVCVIIGVTAESLSAVYQGMVCALGISNLPRTRGGILTGAMMLAVFVELIGVLGMVAAIVALSLAGLI